MAENKLAMIVLAGGASSRMGQDKSDLLLDGKSFLELQIEKGRKLEITKIYISGYRGEHCTEEVVMDRITERGPLGGLEACLYRAAQDGAEHCLVLSVDTPLAPVSELENLIRMALTDTEDRVTLLRHNGREESLIAVYETGLHQDIRAFLEQGQSSVFRFLNKIGYACYDAEGDDLYFTNINDPQIYEKIKTCSSFQSSVK